MILPSRTGFERIFTKYLVLRNSSHIVGVQAPYLLKVGIYNIAIEGAHNKEKQVVDNVKDSYMFISGWGIERRFNENIWVDPGPHKDWLGQNNFS